MTNDSSDFAVLMVVFNRPHCFRSLIESVRVAAPKRIYVAADGPRADRADERRLCEETRQMVSLIDWDCKIETRFLDENRGLDHGVSSALQWFFANESEGIILEDDCRPAPEFFSFCREMLARYRDDSKVMHVSGCNLGARPEIFGGHAYGFASFPLVWGWASWRRAFEEYRVELAEEKVPNRSAFRREGIGLPHAHAIRSTMLKVARGKIRTWDYQWVMKIMQAGGLCVIPRSNLVTNIGFGEGATTTVDPHSPMANLRLDPAVKMDWPMREAEAADAKLDWWYVRQSYGPWLKLTKRLLKDWIRRRS